MGTRSLMARALSTLVLMSVAGCADRQTLLEVTDPTLPLAAFFDTAPAPGFEAVLRDDPLSSDIVVTMVLGENGGKLEAGGISLVVPRGALDGPTPIVMRALKGRPVAVEFGPHGLQFNQPVQIRYDIDDTNVEEYFEDLEDHDDEDDGLSMSEFMGVYYELNTGGGNDPVELFQLRYENERLILETSHFSGYVAASG